MPLALGSLTLSDFEESIDILIQNIRGGVIIDMQDDDYTMTDEEAEAAIKVVINSGDGTKTLTFPTTSDSTVPAIMGICGAFAGANFFIKSETFDDPLEILVPSPTCDIIFYSSAGPILSIYHSYISNDAYDASWDGSLLAPTQDAVYDKIESMSFEGMKLESISTLTAGTTTYTPSTSEVNAVIMYVQGGGGGGGGASTAAVSAAAGGGGSAGSTCYLFAAVEFGVNYTCSVGAGGAGGNTSGTDGAAGVLSDITIGATTYTANGGGGGTGATAGATINAVSGGASSVALNGYLNVTGQPGSPGFTLTGLLGVSGNGGSSNLGAGGVGRTTNGDGNGGTGGGAGGAGGLVINGGTAANGGAGADGIILVFEYSIT